MEAIRIRSLAGGRPAAPSAVDVKTYGAAKAAAVVLKNFRRVRRALNSGIVPPFACSLNIRGTRRFRSFVPGRRPGGHEPRHGIGPDRFRKELVEKEC